MVTDAAFARHHAATNPVCTAAVILHLQRSDAAAGIRGDSSVVKTLIQCGWHKQLRQLLAWQLANYLQTRLEVNEAKLERLIREAFTANDDTKFKIYHRAKEIQTQSLMIVEALKWLSTNTAHN